MDGKNFGSCIAVLSTIKKQHNNTHTKNAHHEVFLYNTSGVQVVKYIHVAVVCKRRT